MATGSDDGRLAKTGWYYSDAEPDIGWYVGWQNYQEPEGAVTYIFAFNMDMDDRSKDPPKRVKVIDDALNILTGFNKR